MSLSKKIFLGLAAATVASAAAAGTANFSGTLSASDPVFNRPLAGAPPTGLSAAGTAVSYDVFPFFVTAPDSYTLQTLSASLAPSTIGPDDTFIVLYQTSFNPLSPLTNALVADDDSGPGFLSLATRPLTPGAQYFLVVTSFSNGAFGAYTGSITNPGNGTAVLGAVPEPSVVWMMGGALAFGALVAARRRKAG